MCLSIPGLVVEVHEDGQSARVAVDGRVVDALLATLDHRSPPVVRGEWLLVQNGLAIERLDETSARSLLELIDVARREVP